MYNGVNKTTSHLTANLIKTVSNTEAGKKFRNKTQKPQSVECYLQKARKRMQKAGVMTTRGLEALTYMDTG